MEEPHEGLVKETGEIPPSNIKLRFRYDLHAIDDPDRIGPLAEELATDMLGFFKPDEENYVYMESSKGKNVVEAIETSPGYEKYKQFRLACAYNYFFFKYNRDPNEAELQESLRWFEAHRRTFGSGLRYLQAVLDAHDKVLALGYKVHFISERGVKSQEEVADHSTLSGFKEDMHNMHNHREARNKDALTHMYEIARSNPNSQFNFYPVLGLFHYGIKSYIPEDYQEIAGQSFAAGAFEKFKARDPFTLDIITNLVDGKETSEALWEKGFEESQK